MAFYGYEESGYMNQLTNYLDYMFPILNKTLYDARRCSEGLKAVYMDWSQCRSHVLQNLSQFHKDILDCNLMQHEDKICTARDICDKLLEDKRKFENILRMLDEYLNYASEIKRILEEAEVNKLPNIIVCAAEVYDFAETSDKVASEDKRLFDVLPLLSIMDVWTGGQSASLGAVIEILKFLFCHWLIIEELDTMKRNKGPVCDITLFPDKFLDDSNLQYDPLTYYDLVSNLSLVSSAEGMLVAMTKMNQENLSAGVEKMCLKLNKTTRAMSNTTRKAERLTELLIAET